MLNSRKTYYSIREVCELTGLEPHVLRYWESEFPQLRPKKNRAGNRAYRDKDIEIIVTIKHLLYEEQYTIPGAKKKLSAVRENTIALRNGTEWTVDGSSDKQVVKKIVDELHDILGTLKNAQ
ncbi:MAG: MerR family transcriptional regulator [Chitinivibrionales bacterium]|nr:MerR family transcriptional regulator [Chitinivibrionales bacterium]